MGMIAKRYLGEVLCKKKGYCMVLSYVDIVKEWFPRRRHIFKIDIRTIARGSSKQLKDRNGKNGSAHA